MTSSDKKTPPGPIPAEGRVFGNVEGLPGYRRELRHTIPVVDPENRSEAVPPQWTPQSAVESTSWRPLFEVLGTDLPPPMTPEEERELAKEEARKEGFAAGFEAARMTVETLLARYEGAIEELELVRERVMADSEVDVVNLALLVAREAIGGEPETRADFTRRMVEHCLSLLRSADRITLRVGPSDLDAIGTIEHQSGNEQRVVRIIEDSSISLGGVVAECSLGRVDATFERRVSDIAVQLLGEDAYSRNESTVNEEPAPEEEQGGGEEGDV